MKTPNTTVRLPDEMREALEVMADERVTTPSQLIRQAVDKFLRDEAEKASSASDKQAATYKKKAHG